MKKDECSDTWFHEMRIEALCAVESLMKCLADARDTNNLIQNSKRVNPKTISAAKKKMLESITGATSAAFQMEVALELMP